MLSWFTTLFPRLAGVLGSAAVLLITASQSLQTWRRRRLGTIYGRRSSRNTRAGSCFTSLRSSCRCYSGSRICISATTASDTASEGSMRGPHRKVSSGPQCESISASRRRVSASRSPFVHSGPVHRAEFQLPSRTLSRSSRPRFPIRSG